MVRPCASAEESRRAATKRALSEVAGTFSVPFGSPKGTLIGDIPLKKVAHRKVVSHARSRIKNQSTPFSQETSAGFGWKPT